MCCGDEDTCNPDVRTYCMMDTHQAGRWQLICLPSLVGRQMRLLWERHQEVVINTAVRCWWLSDILPAAVSSSTTTVRGYTSSTTDASHHRPSWRSRRRSRITTTTKKQKTRKRRSWRSREGNSVQSVWSLSPAAFKQPSSSLFPLSVCSTTVHQESYHVSENMPLWVTLVEFLLKIQFECDMFTNQHTLRTEQNQMCSDPTLSSTLIKHNFLQQKSSDWALLFSLHQEMTEDDPLIKCSWRSWSVVKGAEV